MTGIIKVDTIQNNGGTTGLTIDSSGRVSYPQLPAFFVTRSASYGVSDAVGTIQLDTKQVDTANAFNTSTYTYTIPKAGLWMFNATLSATGLSASERYFGIDLHINGSTYMDLYENWHYGATNAYMYVSLQAMRECIVGDTVLLKYNNSDSGNFTLNHDSKRTKLMGWFLG